jgi:hypothetical protein
LVAQYAGLLPAFLLAAAALLFGAATIRLWPLLDVTGLDGDSVVHWPEPSLVMNPDPDVGPILVTTSYTVAENLEEAFMEAMQAVRLSRLQTGAVTWELYRGGETAHRFIETYIVPSWGEHLRQHGGRATSADKAIDQKARALSNPKPTVKHLFPAEPFD